MMAAITGATISGTSRIVCTSRWPQNGRLSSKASAEAHDQGAEHAHDHEQEGVGQDDLEERRVGEHGLVVGEADPDLLRIVERPVAEAGIGADRDRHDLEQQQKQRGGRDQEQHEALLLAEYRDAVRPPSPLLPFVSSFFFCPDDAGFPNWLEAAFPAIPRRDANPAVPRSAGTRRPGRARSAARRGGGIDGDRAHARDGGADRPRRPRARSDRAAVRAERRGDRDRAGGAGRSDRRRGALAGRRASSIAIPTACC